ncbi:MAG: peptide chain release factor N(5)-glutamine methyltransferase [Sphingobium sp.]
MSVAQALRDAALLLDAVSDTPRLDAELLLAHALGMARADLLLRQHELSVPEAFAALLTRRRDGAPIAHITGTRDFWTLTLRVTPDALIPRPDSETLIEAAIAHFHDRAPKRILDLGTGSGALLLAALDQWQAATGLGIDRSLAALDVAQDNATRLGLGQRAEFLSGDWGQGVEGRFDLILCNPPYVARGAALAGDVLREPASALFAGDEGLDDYRRIAPQLTALLAPAGVAAIEIGHDQAASVAALLEAEGLATRLYRDLAGRDRCLIVRTRLNKLDGVGV